MANSYQTSSGDRILKTVLDARVREAKQDKINSMLDDHGYVFCEEKGCGKNASAGEPLDCSHTISVDQCQKHGMSELAYDVSNIMIRCRTCHRKHDKTL